jgi:S1-C subfamily serine protease
MRKGAALIVIMGIVTLACTGNILLSTPTARPYLPVPTSTPEPESVGVSSNQPLNVNGNSAALSALFERVNPGVVAVFAYNDNGEGGLGSGFVVDTEGHIVTNLHVVQQGADIEVDFPSGLITPGIVVGEDPDSDLAVIEVDIPADELHPLELGDSSQVKVGDSVIAIGNPYGLYSTLTTGIVSAKGRTDASLRPSGESGFFTLADMIQTDTAINPGNSGGPLMNMRGQVIGINRSILSESVTAQGDVMNSGLGFAVSSNILRRVLPSLIANGKYEYPWLGLSALPEIHLPAQTELNLPYSYGVYVTSTVVDGPVDRAGIRAGTQTLSAYSDIRGGGDLILAINGVVVRNFAELTSYLVLNTQPGDTITLTVYRDGGTLDIDVVLGSRS